MMLVTQQHQVRQVGGTALAPVCDVVCLCHAGWLVAAREGATSISGYQGASASVGDEALGSAEVEGDGVCVAHHGNHPGVAGEPPDR